MRLTVYLPDTIAEELKALAKTEGLSVSRFVAKSLEHYINETRKKEHAEKILKLVGKAHVSDEALYVLDRDRFERLR